VTTLDKELKNLLEQTVTLYPYLSRDEHNDYVWNMLGFTTFKGRIELTNILVRDRMGQETLSTCRIYCDSDTVIDYRDKISAPEFATQYPEILKIDLMPDETGKLYYKCIYTK
jgi:hypothetical protein